MIERNRQLRNQIAELTRKLEAAYGEIRRKRNSLHLTTAEQPGPTDLGSKRRVGSWANLQDKDITRACTAEVLADRTLPVADAQDLASKRVDRSTSLRSR